MRMIGTYYRLSLADEDVGADKAESNSIQGQRGLVEGYIMARPELAAELRQEYVDDGYSGTSTSRPAFQRLIQDAQDGKLKTIIVKDFSRFARDYIEAGDYMERIFPLLGVRFISVNDGYDSGMQAGNDVRGLEVAIKNIINASYSRDLSAKIAAADHVMQKKGMYLGGYRPFGFLPDPNDCHKLILDPVASQYVRLIFELALQGNRTGTIAKILNEKQIPTPAAYHVVENHVYSEQKAWDLQRSHWTSGTVYHVLKNEKYKGTYVGAKFIMPVPCKHRVLRAPLEQQVRIEDSHAAIVTPEEFEQAQKVIMLQHGNHQTGNYTKHQYPLKGKVYCGYCQKLMKYRVLKKLGPSFNCRFSATAVDSPCKRIPISEELLEEIVRNALTAQIKQAEHVLEILHERERKALICFSALERQEEKLSAEKAEIVKQRVALYEQYADGNISKEEFILGLKVFISLQGRVNLYRTHNLRQHLIGNAARSQDSGNSTRCIHHGGFQPDAAGAAIKHTGNFSLHILQHVLSIRRARTTGNIGRRRRNRATAGADKILGEFIGWEAYSDSFQSCAYSVRHNSRFIDNQRQRSRPKMLHKLFCISVQAGSQLRNIFLFSDMQNQRIIVRSALGSKNLGYSLRIQSIRTQAVNCFRRE